MYGIRVPDDGTVTSYREIKLKMGFGVLFIVVITIKYTCNLQLIDDLGSLRLQRAIETDIQ